RPCHFFPYNTPSPPPIHTLSLHDALPICNNGDLTFTNQSAAWGLATPSFGNGAAYGDLDGDGAPDLVVNNDQVGRPVADEVAVRSEEHTSELQSRSDLVCRLLLEKKKKRK